MQKFTRTRHKRVRTNHTTPTKKKNGLVALFTTPTNNTNGNNGNGINKHLNAGRKTKLTPQLQHALIKAVCEDDMTINRACMLCGITDPTFFNWKNAGEAERDRIADEIQTAKDIAIEAGRLNPLDSLEIESFVERKLKKIKPNKYFNFFISIKKAEAEAEKRSLNAIQKARDGGKYLTEIHILRDKEGNVTGEKEIKKHLIPQWTAAAWLLERKHPELYGRKMTHDGNVNIDHEIKIGIAIIPETAIVPNWQEKYSPKNIDGKPKQIVNEE